MRLLVLPMLFVVLSACGATGPWRKTPTAASADEIEAKLRPISCVGPMARWERHYAFSSKPSLLALLLTLGISDRWFNYRSIDIAYYQAGFEEFRAGRFLGQDRTVGADDRQYNLVFGHYDIPTHTASLWACGPNMNGAADLNIVVR